MNRFVLFLLGAVVGAAVLVGVQFFRGEELASGRRKSDEPPRQVEEVVLPETRAVGAAPRQILAPRTPIVPTVGTKAIGGSAGSITGRVTRADGSAVEGAVVRVTEIGSQDFGRFERERVGDGVPIDRSIEELKEDLVRGVAAERAARREATSDAEGHYTVAGLGSGTYRIAAWLRGHEVQPRSRGRYTAKAGSVVDFVARPIILVPVEVLLPDGTKPQGAQISMTTGQSGTSEYWRPAWGEIRCAPGNWSMYAIAGEDQRYRSDSQDVILKMDVAPAPLVFHLKERPGIKGRLLGVDPDALERVGVYALRYVGEPPDDSGVIRNGARANAYPNADYDFWIMDLEEGSYVLGAKWGHPSPDDPGKLAARALVELKGPVRQDLNVAPDDARAITVWVLAPDGTPQPDVYLSITTFQDSHSSNTNTLQGVKRGDGSIRASIPALPRRDGREKDLLVARSERFGTTRGEVDLDRDTTATLRFAEPATLSVTVPNYAGSRLQGLVSLTLVQDAGTGKSMQHNPAGRLSAEGVQTFSAMQPGTYLIVLSAPLQVARVPVTLVPGRNTANVSLPPLFRVTVIAGEEHRGGHIAARTDDGSFGQSRVVADDGQTIFEAFPAGNYVFSLRSSKGAGKTKPVTIASDAVVRFAEGEVLPVNRPR
jgi:hypothetical protein